MNRPAESRPAEPDFDALRFLILSILTVAALAVCLPALVVAVPLAMAIENGGWRRWPVLVAGGALTGLVLLAGGWDAYRHTVVSIWAHLRFHHPFRPVELLALFPLGAAGGIFAAPLLPTIVHHRNEHEATRHYRELSAARRHRAQAQRSTGRPGSWPEPDSRTVLGVPLGGAISNWRLPSWKRPLVAAPLEIWRRQALIVGETGSGKTVTALTLAGEALRGGWDVYWVDGKADPATADQFLGLARAAGIEAHDGSRDPLDGWRGDPEAIINRLLATQTFTEPYYEGIARTVLRHAVGDRPPRSFGELVARLDKRALQRAARDDPEALEAIRAVPDKDVAGVRARYDGVAWAVGATLDGTWSYEDARAAYVPVGRPENRHQAAEVGAFLLEDILHWALARKQPDRQALVVVDEFSKLSDRPGAAVDLIERARSFNVAVVLIAQTLGQSRPRRHDPEPPRRHRRHRHRPPTQAVGRDRLPGRHGMGPRTDRADPDPPPHRPRQPTSRKPLRRPPRRHPPPPPRRSLHHPQRPSAQAPDPATTFGVDQRWPGSPLIAKRSGSDRRG